MSKKPQTLLLATVLAMANPAFALINDGRFGDPGELFIAVFDPDGERSYYRDLGVDMAQFLGKPAGTYDLSKDANFAPFLGKPGVVFNIAAIYPLKMDLTNLDTWGYLATSIEGAGVFTPDFVAIDDVRQKIETYVTNLNPEPFNGTPEETAENLSGVFGADDPAYFDGELWGASMAGSLAGGTAGPVGSPVEFYYVSNFTGDETGGVVRRLGVWTLSAGGQLTFSTGSGAVNTPPQADAGPALEVEAGAEVVLDGSASSDPDDGPGALTYAWSQVGGPEAALSGADTANPSFVAEQAGTYRFQLTVSDGADSSTATVQVEVRTADGNTPPIAAAGPDRTANPGVAVVLDGGASSDPDHGPAPLTYAWNQVDGPPVALSGADTAQAVFTPVQPGVYTFTLTVDDGGAQAQDSVVITVDDPNAAPVADAGADQTVDQGATVVLDGGASHDPDQAPGPLTYAWVQQSGPPAALLGADTASPTFVAAEAGAYAFQLTVSDGAKSAAATVRVTVDAVNAAPLARAGNDRTVNREARVILDGTGSGDPDHGPEPLSYGWSQVSGPEVGLVGADTATPSFTANEAGVYVFRLIVSDGALSSEATVAITVNTAPIANAGPDLTVAQGARVVLDGSASGDPDRVPNPLAYLWTQLEGPPASLADADTAQASFTADRLGVHTFKLTVSDGAAAEDATVLVKVSPIALDVPEVWTAGRVGTIAWNLGEIPGRRQARIAFAADGAKFKAIRQVPAKRKKIVWKPKAKHATDQGVLRICVGSAKKGTKVCDAVGIVVQP
jgi:PKD repeat protein